MNGNGVDIMTIVIIVLSALLVGGGAYAVIAKRKLKEAEVLFASLAALIRTFLDASEDGTITPDERTAIVDKVQAVVSAFIALISAKEWQAVQLKAARKRLLD